jgi:hypothetical protein
MQKKVEVSKDQLEMESLANEIGQKILSFKKNKKCHLIFLKNLDELLSTVLDNKQITSLQKSLSDQYNAKLMESKPKKNSKAPKVKLDMRNNIDDELNDYEDDDDDQYYDA